MTSAHSPEYLHSNYDGGDNGGDMARDLGQRIVQSYPFPRNFLFQLVIREIRGLRRCAYSYFPFLWTGPIGTLFLEIISNVSHTYFAFLAFDKFAVQMRFLLNLKILEIFLNNIN